MPTPEPTGPGLVQADLANECIRANLAVPGLAGIWTEEGVTRHSNVRVVYEHAEVVGDSGESLAVARHKNLGRFLGITPFAPTPRSIPAASSITTSLVTNKSQSTRGDSLMFDLSPDGASAIFRRLKLDQGRLWRVAKG